MENNTTFEKTFSILEQTGTNWSVEKLPLVTECGKTTGSFGIFRSDTGGWISTFKDSYEPMQNSTLVELLVQATEMVGLEITNGGLLRNGGRVYYQMELPDKFVGKSNVKRNLTALNSHDGSSCIGFGSTNTVVICNNTFNRAHREIEKVKHTINSLERVKMLADNLKTTLISDQKMFMNFEAMSAQPIRDEMVEKLIRKLFETDSSEKLSNLSTRKKNQIETFAGSLDTEIKLEGRTVWGLFNAVTRYTNHEAAPKDEEKKTDYLIYGTGAKLNNLAYNELIKWIDANTAELVEVMA